MRNDSFGKTGDEGGREMRLAADDRTLPQTSSENKNDGDEVIRRVTKAIENRAQHDCERIISRP